MFVIDNACRTQLQQAGSPTKMEYINLSFPPATMFSQHIAFLSSHVHLASDKKIVPLRIPVIKEEVAIYKDI